MQIVTAGKGKDELKLKSTLTFLGYESRYVNLIPTKYANNMLATKNISNQTHLNTPNVIRP